MLVALAPSLEPYIKKKKYLPENIVEYTRTPFSKFDCCNDQAENIHYLLNIKLKLWREDLMIT